MKETQKLSLFARMAIRVGDMFGSPANFNAWLIIIGAWLCTGPLFNFDNTWQLMINTPTTIIELFAAILIQYVGNRIERRQEEAEQYMIQLLEENRQVSAQNKAMLEHIQTLLDHLGIKPNASQTQISTDNTAVPDPSGTL